MYCVYIVGFHIGYALVPTDIVLLCVSPNSDDMQAFSICCFVLEVNMFSNNCTCVTCHLQ